MCILLQLHHFVQNNFTSARMALVGLGMETFVTVFPAETLKEINPNNYFFFRIDCYTYFNLTFSKLS